MAFGELVGDHVSVGFRVLEQGGAIRRGGGNKNGLYASVKTFVQRGNEIWIFDK